jgi:hypothetical protein
MNDHFNAKYLHAVVQGSTQALVCHIFEGNPNLLLKQCKIQSPPLRSLEPFVIEMNFQICSLFSTLLELFFSRDINFLAHNLTR